MKKLNKRNDYLENTVELYAWCRCDCSCSCYCDAGMDYYNLRNTDSNRLMARDYMTHYR